MIPFLLCVVLLLNGLNRRPVDHASPNNSQYDTLEVKSIQPIKEDSDFLIKNGSLAGYIKDCLVLYSIDGSSLYFIRNDSVCQVYPIHSQIFAPYLRDGETDPASMDTKVSAAIGNESISISYATAKGKKVTLLLYQTVMKELPGRSNAVQADKIPFYLEITDPLSASPTMLVKRLPVQDASGAWVTIRGTSIVDNAIYFGKSFYDGSYIDYKKLVALRKANLSTLIDSGTIAFSPILAADDTYARLNIGDNFLTTYIAKYKNRIYACQTLAESIIELDSKNTIPICDDLYRASLSGTKQNTDTSHISGIIRRKMKEQNVLPMATVRDLWCLEDEYLCVPYLRLTEDFRANSYMMLTNEKVCKTYAVPERNRYEYLSAKITKTYIDMKVLTATQKEYAIETWRIPL